MANKSSNIKERILQLTDFKRIAKEKFFPQIGMSYGNFKGKSKMAPLNSNAIADIFAMFPDLNLEWLITGEGPKEQGIEAASLLNSHSNEGTTRIYAVGESSREMERLKKVANKFA